MASESSNTVSCSSQSASSSSSSSSSAESYIGSLISLTSKYEIRYEGVLCYLNPQDSTLGLKNDYVKPERLVVFQFASVPRFGTIVPKRDLEVKSSAPPQKDDPIHNDPAIIQSHGTVGPSSSSNSAPGGGGSLTELSSYQGYPTLTNLVNPITMPSYLSGIQIGPWGPTQTMQNANVASFPMPVYWQGPQGYNGASSSIPSAPQLASPSVPISATIAPSLPTLQNLSQAAVTQASMNIGFPYASYVMNTVDTSVVGGAGSDPASVVSAQPLPYSATPVLDRTSGSLINLPPTLLTPEQLMQSRPPVVSPSQKPFPDQKDLGTLNSMTTPVVQEPLLPLPLSARKSWYSEPQSAEEFDFEAMNEKFKKEEVRGYLGNQKQWDKAEGMEDNTEEGVYGSAPKLDPKPAYSTDEFFDTISCNLHVRGVNNGQNRFSGGMRMDAEQRPHLGYGGYGAGRGEFNRGPFNSGRGYNYGRRGRGGNFRI